MLYDSVLCPLLNSANILIADFDYQYPTLGEDFVHCYESFTTFIVLAARIDACIGGSAISEGIESRGRGHPVQGAPRAPNPIAEAPILAARSSEISRGHH